MEANKIIITGGANRIGGAISRKLSAPGVEIVIHYNESRSSAEKLKKELKVLKKVCQQTLMMILNLKMFLKTIKTQKIKIIKINLNATNWLV